MTTEDARKPVGIWVLLPNNKVFTLDGLGDPVPELSGDYSGALLDAIIARSDRSTEWYVCRRVATT